MNIKFTNEVFGLQDQKKDLSYLIKTIERKKHKIVFDPDFQEVPTWLGSDDKNLLEEYFSTSMIGDTPTPHCEVVKDASTISNEKIFSIQEAIEYANTPLTVMVENSNNDSPLIRLIFDLYTKERTTPYYERRLDFDHAGGCGAIKGIITEKLEQNGKIPKMLRYYVIVDGDKRYQTQEVIKYKKLVVYLDQLNIPYHVFEKRCMENYMPSAAFPNSSGNTNWLNAYKALSPTQRDYYNIGGGLKGDLPDETKKNLKNDNSNIRALLSAELQNFYSDVPEVNLIRLAEGYDIKHFKEEFPKGFDSASITREMLDAIQLHQSNTNELKQLAKDIMDLL